MTSAAVAPVFADGGVMGARMRALDWASTPLGPAHAWPQSLKTAVRIMLSSRFAMWMAWGPDLTFFCNDAYKPTLGVKEAWALGSRSDAVWSEIWPEVSPRIDRVLTTGEATWDEGLRLFLERRGFPEETYHTFSYSPLADEDGAIAGMLCVVTEETERVIGERRLRVLRDLGSRLAHARSADDVWGAVKACLAAESRDLPFTVAYAFEEDGAARRVSATGLTPGSSAGPDRIGPSEDDVWPLARAAAAGSAILVGDVAERFADLPTGPEGVAPNAVIISPLLTSGATRASGAFVSALNPFRPLDAGYRGFVDLFVSQITAGLANAQAYEAERRRAEALADIDRAKTAFFSNVSHEFRTPLTLMLGPLEEVLEKADSGVLRDNRRLVEVAHRNGVRLLRLVNTLLDFSRVEAGRVDATFQPVDLGAYTADLASSFRSATARAGLSLEVTCASPMGPVHVDPEMWEKIVLNLLSNAFKFTFQGGIVVEVDQADGAARLRVRDTGTGVPAAELPRLFERFHRVEGARGRSFEGSGIGLALVQDLVKSHHGSISVTSELDRGTTFTIAIPLGTDHLEPSRIRQTDAASRRPTLAHGFVEEALRWLPEPIGGDLLETVSGREDLAAGAKAAARIVLADDNADLRAYIARLLRAKGYAVDVFNNGRAALDSLIALRPDLLVTDVMMPELDGFGLLRAVRTEPALRDLPVVMLSARAGEEAEVEGLEAGADDYLTKPFSARELLARVASNLSTARVRREAIAALEESEARFRNMADQAPVMMWVADPAGACTYMNRAWYAFTGRADGEALGYGWREAIDPRDREAITRSFRATAAATGAVRLDYRLRRADGALRWVTAAAAPRLSPDGEFLGYIGSVLDVTEQKETEASLERRVVEEMAARAEAEDALRQAQKMEAVGQLTGGIAHDFNNLLTIISGNIGITGRALDAAGVTDSRARRALGNALKGAERAASLTHRLLAFSRRQPLSPKPTDVDRLVGGMSDLLHRALGETIELEVVTSPGLWAVEVDPNQLESALLNLAVNARDAMPGGGRLTIETANARLDETYSAKHAEVAPGHYVVLAVTDTGDGMDKETLARVFEPFFTTKEVGKGTGLGLSMVYGFTKQSGGHVKLYSEPGQGTTVKIYLPRLMSGTEQAAPEPAPDPVPAQRSQTILVVEDDGDVRTYTVDILRELGYRVLEAHDGPAALRLVERRGEAISLMFTDVVMPGMSGSDLVNKARALRPGLKVLFTSGYTRNAIVHGGRLDPGVEMIAKPFTFQALAEKVQDVLDRGLTDRILVVDPDLASRVALRSDLSAAGYAVEEAATAQEALGTVRAAQGRFDAVVLKGATGRSVEKTARELRALFADLPLLLLVVKGATELRRRFEDDRCVGVLAAPVAAPELQAALSDVGLRCSRGRT